VPTVDRAKATVMTKIRFDELDPRILPEMSAKVSFLSQEVTADQQKPLMAVNPDAIVERNGRSVVFVIRDNKASEVPVTKGAKLSDLVTMTVFLIDARYTSFMTEPRTEIFGRDFPASAAITVAGFADPSMMIEIQGIAVAE